MTSNTTVPTDKPRITCYVTSEIKQKIKSRAGLSGLSESAEAGLIIADYLDDESVVIKLSEETVKSLENWAKEDLRTLETQIAWIVEKALRDKKK
jgi:hypothetical protein